MKNLANLRSRSSSTASSSEGQTSDACTLEADDLTQQLQHQSLHHHHDSNTTITSSNMRPVSAVNRRPHACVFPLAFAERNTRSAPQRRPRISGMRPVSMHESVPSGHQQQQQQDIEQPVNSNSKLSRSESGVKLVQGPKPLPKRHTWFFTGENHADSSGNVQVLSFKPIATTVRVKHDRPPRSRTTCDNLMQLAAAASRAEAEDDDTWDSLREPVVTWDALGLHTDNLLGECGLTVSAKFSLFL